MDNRGSLCFRKTLLVTAKKLVYNENYEGKARKSKMSEERDELEKVCFMCRRPESKAGKMISLPNHIHICTECMQKSFDSMNSNGYGEWMSHLPPNVSMIDLSALQNNVTDRQRVKKKKTEKKEEKKNLTGRIFRRRIRLKKCWMSM